MVFPSIHNTLTATDSLMDGGTEGRPPDLGLGDVNPVGFVNTVGNTDVTALNESHDEVVSVDSDDGRCVVRNKKSHDEVVTVGNTDVTALNKSHDEVVSVDSDDGRCVIRNKKSQGVVVEGPSKVGEGH
ncbi:hypothetical protein V6N13_122541 [Hibiscus sabdariffa]